MIPVIEKIIPVNSVIKGWILRYILQLEKLSYLPRTGIFMSILGN